MNEYLEYNTERQGAAAGYISGYKVAGKTGTTEKRGVTKFESSFLRTIYHHSAVMLRQTSADCNACIL